VSADAEIVIGARDQASNVLRKVGGNVTSLSGILKTFGPVTVGATAAIAGLAAGLVAFEKASTVILERAKEIDELAKAANRVGESVGDLQAFQFALGEVAGVGAETAQQALAELRKSIGEGLAGGEKATFFEQLGLDAQSLSQAGTVEAFSKIREALSQVENGAQRAAIAEKLLGGEARKLMGLLGDQSDAFAHSMQAASDLGLTISDSGAAGVESMNDALGRANATLEGIVTQATVALAPAIEMVADRIVEIGATLQGADLDDWVQGGVALAGVTYDVLNNIQQVVDALRFISTLGTQGDLSLDFSSGTAAALTTELMEKQARNAQAAIDKAIARVKAQREALDTTVAEVESRRAKRNSSRQDDCGSRAATQHSCTWSRRIRAATAISRGNDRRGAPTHSGFCSSKSALGKSWLKSKKKFADREAAMANQGPGNFGVSAVQGRLITRGAASDPTQKLVKVQERSLTELQQIKGYLEEQVRNVPVELVVMGGGA